MSSDLPYSVEYAKSSRASCQNCKKSIQKDTLRLATIVQSPVHDGTIPRWYHADCFFEKQRPKSSADIANFDAIRWEDQETIKKQIEKAAELPAPAKGRKRKGAGKGSKASGDFLVQYAKSNQSTCKGCQEKIIKGDMRVSRKDYESEEARRYGGIDRWHHLECFVKLRSEFQFYESGDALPGAKELSPEDRKTLKNALPKISPKEDAPPVKKLKEEPEDKEETEQMRKQNEEMYAVRDKLSAMKKNDMGKILEQNEQQIPEGASAILDRLTDMVCFGALKPCPKCSGQLVYQSGLGYKCSGDLTEWTKCEYVTQNPKRKQFTVPSDIREAYPELKLKSKVKQRIVKVTAAASASSSSSSTAMVKKEEDQADAAGPKIQAAPKLLKHMEFFILSTGAQKNKEAIKKEIMRLGGTVSSKIHENLAAVIGTPKDIEKMNKKMSEAQELDIQVVSEDFVEAAKSYKGSDAVGLIKEKTISEWGGDPAGRISKLEETANRKSKAKSVYEKSGSGKMKMHIKGGGAVDADTGLQDRAHVYQRGKEKFTATLVCTDIQTKRNSYYKLQILKHDKQNKYWLFRSWGRIGTTIGGTKLEELPCESCIEQFENLYEEKSGNSWKRRENFVKVPHKMYPVDVDHGVEEIASLESNIKSSLSEPVQELIKLIFNEANMKKVMAEFEIDTEKMPLGKLSKKQIQKAYSVLTELQELLKSDNPERMALVDGSNRFYNLIPHNFGVGGPQILDKSEEIQAKCEMLDALLEMEIAYSLLHGKSDQSKNPLDAHYEQLNADLEVLEKESEEYAMINRYVRNTHAATHTQYQLEIEDVFVVKRHGEEKRYRPFKKLHNRKLLWHGSRTTNFAGILSQGLRIAPPEAPVTGYMFGKGIYFADMVSKSANYCCTNSEDSTGLLLLCEVALGNMYERYRADYIEKLPKGKHSTMGCGQTQPDPKDVYKTEDGVEVPYGVPTKLSRNSSSLLYNEYIVYDVAQVKTRYLLKMKFKYT